MLKTHTQRSSNFEKIFNQRKIRRENHYNNKMIIKNEYQNAFKLNDFNEKLYSNNERLNRARNVKTILNIKR